MTNLSKRIPFVSVVSTHPDNGFVCLFVLIVATMTPFWEYPHITTTYLWVASLTEVQKPQYNNFQEGF